MTKVDERARVPEVDGAAVERLGRAVDREGVVAAMLIGSQARGAANPLSDIDIAYWHEPGLDRDRSWKLRLELIAAAEGALGTGEIDMVPLNGAPPLMQQRAIRDGVRLVTRAMLDYFDTQPLRDALRGRLGRLFAEDRFGRR
jgi:uncharacterized protein